MHKHIVRFFGGLDLEEKILNGSSLIALIAVFLPWFSGEWLGDERVSFSGFAFFTSFLGTAVFLLHAIVIAITVAPAITRRPLIHPKHKDAVRLCLSSQAAVLSLASISVLMNVTDDYTRMEIRFGVFITFAGSVFATLYSFWKFQEHRRNAASGTFAHPEDRSVPEETHRAPQVPVDSPPPPAPPSPPPPEEHPTMR